MLYHRVMCGGEQNRYQEFENLMKEFFKERLPENYFNTIRKKRLNTWRNNQNRKLTDFQLDSKLCLKLRSSLKRGKKAGTKRKGVDEADLERLMFHVKRKRGDETTLESLTFHIAIKEMDPKDYYTTDTTDFSWILKLREVGHKCVYHLRLSDYEFPVRFDWMTCRIWDLYREHTIKYPNPKKKKINHFVSNNH